MKDGLKKLKCGSIETKLSRFLFAYRVTPHSSTGTSPAELIFNRRLRTPMDNLRPNLDKRMQQAQEQQKSTYDRRARARNFVVGDLVYARNYSPGDKWLPGEVVEVLGSTMYEVCLTDGRKVRKHGDQLKSRVLAENPDETSEEADSSDDFDVRMPKLNDEVIVEPRTEHSRNAETLDESVDGNKPEEPHIASEGDTHTSDGGTVEPNVNLPGPRRSSRARNCPDRYGH